jgi:hypothetical protein
MWKGWERNTGEGRGMMIGRTNEMYGVRIREKGGKNIKIRKS